MNGCHPKQEQAKVEFLEKLYSEDGRTSKKHPDYGLYTGLYQKWLQSQEKPAQSNEE